ncbi:hypothetical protein pb186bvf_012877 [Paramecium bursaria]
MEEKVNEGLMLDLIQKFEANRIFVDRQDIPIVQTPRFYPPKQKNYKAQYAHINTLRNELLRDRFDWINKNNLKENIQQLNHKDGEVKLFGMISKEMKYKPHYFNQVSQLNTVRVTDPTDYCYIEDRTGRIRIAFKNCRFISNLFGSYPERDITHMDLVTGIVCMLEGRLQQNNSFMVTKIFLPSLAPQQIPQVIFQKPHYLCIASGLNYEVSGNSYFLNQFVNFIQGNTYHGYGQILSQQISQVVIAGNLFAKQGQDPLTGSMKVQQEYKQLYEQMAANIRGLDDIIDKMNQVTPINLMPGPNDAVNQLLPQNPFTRTYFQKCFESSEVQFLSNPCEFSINGYDVIGSSGQNIQDILKYQEFSDQEIDLMEQTILWSNIAPTAPDSLKCYPYTHDDPFVLKELPHIYFCGNMSEFKYKRIQDKCLLLTIPDLKTTGQFALINLSNLECIKFELQ